ncbi:MAG: hypothetical protein M0P00_07140 [Bacteroidaceae bacterium]|nr:hypothetical protein [Bacteroidaceae bacterium]
MKEEDEILKRIGKRNPFKVPDNYFENFTSEMMSKLPEKEESVLKMKTHTLKMRLRPLYYVAALIIGAVFIIQFGFRKTGSTEKEGVITKTEVTASDRMIDELVDRSMLDDYSLYVYLSDADGE